MGTKAIKSVRIEIAKARGGWHASVEAFDKDGDYVYDTNDEQLTGTNFILPGEDLDPTELGKQIIASLVEFRMSASSKGRR